MRNVPLLEGWNLVGWTGATPITEATAAIAGTFNAVFTWDATSQRFRSYNPSLPANLNTLSDLELGDAVWIRVASPGGALWPQTRSDGPRTVSLRTGFNLVTWTGPDATPVGVAIAGLGPAMETLLLWDAASQRFRSFSPDVPSVLNTVTALNYGDAMWLLVNRTATWRQPAP